MGWVMSEAPIKAPPTRLLTRGFPDVTGLFRACYGRPVAYACRMASSSSRPSAPSEHPDGWPGKDLGLPEDGPRSVGRIGRRIVALLIDGALADLIAYVTGVWSPVNGSGDIAHSWVQLAIFAALQVLFICLLSGSFGHICVGLRVVPMRGGYVGVWRPVVRTVLLCLVVPALIIDRDSRGAHDRIAGTVLVRR
ncbi:putative RDD family membrane protein YckC [Curtobacterium sp. PvP017]|jgi:uncharacterized RDD family membrane protein YckC|nr:RDD family protein [Curtobacterium sp. JUb34]